MSQSSVVAPQTPLQAPQINEALKRYFGHDEFRPGQQEVIENLLAGNSAAAVFPTGGGKSLCYQLPALIFEGLTLVVSPLLALMKDQIDALEKQGIRAARLDSTLDAAGYRQVMQEIRSGATKILYVAPERFNNERFRVWLNSTKVSLFAVDEAHCISEWGHNFRPDYLKLVQFAQDCNAERVLALTATATKEVLKDVCDAFSIKPSHATATGFYRSNLELKITAASGAVRDDMLGKLLSDSEPGPTIVYVTLQKTAENVAKLLSATGREVRHYHAGLKDEQRAQVQEWFIESDSGVVVATIAFGMGIDKANIRYVYHYNLPKSLENYSQEIGRAGRDGKPSTCHLLACTDDLIPLQNFIYGDTPERTAIASLTEKVFSEDQLFDVSLYELSGLCDIRMLVLRTLLTQLELKGYISGGTPFYSAYQFKPLYSSADILAKFDEQRATFIGDIFRQASKSRSWFKLDLEETAAVLGAERSRIVAALDYLAEHQMLEVKAAGVRHRYTIINKPADIAVLINELDQEAQARQSRELDRLQQCIDWVCLNACQTSALCDRFDRALANPCGHCQWCALKTAVNLTSEMNEPIAAQVLQQAVKLRQEHPQLLSSDVALSRVLCGLSTPAISKAKLQKHNLFATLEHIPFQKVLLQIGNK